MANRNPKKLDLTGQVVFRLTVLNEVDSIYTPRPRPGRPNYIHRERRWLCRCECGNTTIVRQTHLRQGVIKSCGCWNREATGQRKRSHGMSRTTMYINWCGMIARTTNPKNSHYQWYGARGIKVCARWRSFNNFLADMGERPSPNHTIERRDNDGDYCPDNCYWATPRQQGANKSNNVLLTLGSETQCLAEWSRRVGLSESMLTLRRKRGWTDEQTLLTPKLKSHAEFIQFATSHHPEWLKPTDNTDHRLCSHSEN